MPTTYSIPVPAGITWDGSNSVNDRCALFLSRLMMLTGLSAERRLGGEYISFHRDKLRTLLGRNDREKLDKLETAEVIETNRKYSVGRFTRSYRLTSRYRTGNAEQFQLTTKRSKEIAQRVGKADDDNLGEVGRWLHRNGTKFQIDADAAARDPKLQGFWAQQNIARWANQDFFSYRCPYGRLHSLLTQSPRPVRKYITTDDGQPLCIVDVSACQPLLLGVLAVLATQQNHTLTHVAQFSVGEEVSIFDFGRIFNEIKFDSDQFADAFRWIDLCERREIYAFLHDRLKEHGPVYSQVITPSGELIELDLTTLSAKAFKRCSLIPLFDTLERTRSNPVFKIIERDFPTIAQYVLESKRGGHQMTAQQLQRLESNLMIDGAAEALRRSHNGEAIQTIHDAILSRETFADDASEAISQEFRRIGVTPNLKREAA